MIATEVAWAAGFVDGEGCFQCQEHKKTPGRYGLRVVVSQADPRPLERLRAAMGGIGSVYLCRPARGTWRPKWEWRVQTFEGAQAVVAMLWRFLSEPKKEQAIKCLRVYANQRPTKRGARKAYPWRRRDPTPSPKPKP